MFLFYNETAVPEATRLDQILIARLRALPCFDAALPETIVAADRPKISPGERRYLLDVEREILYRRFRAEAEKIAIRHADGEDFRSQLVSPERRRDSQNAQNLIALLSRCDRHCGRGEFEALVPLIGEAWTIARNIR